MRIRLKIAWLLASGRSTRRMRTSSTSMPKLLASPFTIWAVWAISSARWLVSTVASGTEPSTLRRLAFTMLSSRARTTASDPTA